MNVLVLYTPQHTGHLLPRRFFTAGVARRGSLLTGELFIGDEARRRERCSVAPSCALAARKEGVFGAMVQWRGLIMESWVSVTLRCPRIGIGGAGREGVDALNDADCFLGGALWDDGTSGDIAIGALVGESRRFWYEKARYHRDAHGERERKEKGRIAATLFTKER